jgi:pimeloyl-ACP methyl ester carboxylesterase
MDVDKLFYIEEGKGPLKAVLVHGAGANKSYWGSLAKQSIDQKILRPDLYGHGQMPSWHSYQPLRTYSYYDDVQLLENLTSQFLTPVDLVGHSSGGAICIEYALRNPQKVNSLVLVEPMLPTILKEDKKEFWDEVYSAYTSSHSKADKESPNEAASILFEYILGDGEWEKLPLKIQKWMGENVSTTLNAHSRASLALPIGKDTYRALHCPTLLIYGSLTRRPYIEIIKCLKERLKISSIQEILGASHNSPLTHQNQVNQLILDFWNEH